MTKKQQISKPVAMQRGHKGPIRKALDALGVLLALLWFLYGLSLFVRRHIYTQLHEILSTHSDPQISALSYFDSFCMILLALIFLFVLWAFLSYKRGSGTGMPDTRKGIFILPRRRSLLLLLFLFPGIVALLLIAPALPMMIYLFDGFHLLFFKRVRHMVPHPIYLIEALLFAFCLAFYVFDRSIKTDGLRWWLLPFLLVPLQPFDRFPLLWVAALAAWFPFRGWAVIKPLAAALTFCLPLLAFFQAWPFYDYHHVPYTNHAQVEILPQLRSYEVMRHPQESMFFAKGFRGLYRYKRVAGQWIKKVEPDINFPWDYMALDPKREKVYIPQAEPDALPALHAFDMHFLTRLRTLNVTDAFPLVESSIFILIDRDLLILVSRDGFVTCCDLDTGALGRAAIVDVEGFRVHSVRVDSKNEELILLHGSYLSVYRTRPLQHVRTLRLPHEPADFILDSKNGRIIIAFPIFAKLAVYDRRTFALIDQADAPLAARSLAMDHQRRYLFIGAMTGVVEVRDIDTLRPIRRVRLAPWIRGLTSFPEIGELAVAFHDQHPVVLWNYREQNARFDPLGTLLQWAEKGIRFHFFVLRKQTLRTRSADDVQRFHLPLNPEPRPRALLVEPDPGVRIRSAAALRMLGYDVLSADNQDAAAEMILAKKDPIDLAITGATQDEKEADRLAGILQKAVPGTQFIWAKERLGDINKPYDMLELVNAIDRFRKKEKQQKDIHPAGNLF